ncbi:MAG: hypothetical protein HN348_33880 [Proteobacteria bacterium]|nr:hypothetical protein [Pseudomonadota bacterium]
MRIVRTRKGDRMAFIRLEDGHSFVECTFFSEPWSRSQRAVRATQGTGRRVSADEVATKSHHMDPILVVGELEVRDGEVKIRARSAELLTDIRIRTTREVVISAEASDLAQRVEVFKRILTTFAGNCRTKLLLRQGEDEGEFELPELSVEPSAAMEEAVNSFFGTEAVGLR